MLAELTRNCSTTRLPVLLPHRSSIHRIHHLLLTIVVITAVAAIDNITIDSVIVMEVVFVNVEVSAAVGTAEEEVST